VTMFSSPPNREERKVGKHETLEDCKNLFNVRVSYSSEEGIPDSAKYEKDPMEIFHRWMSDARSCSGILEPNAMCLSTCVNDRPSSRIVLLKLYDSRGFCFFTNYDSRKGKEISSNPRAALNFYWDALHRAVRIEGSVERTDEDLSDRYFCMRPKSSQVGAWASDQSEPISSRDEIEAKNEVVMAKLLPEGMKHDDAKIDRPPNWGGFWVKPTYIEFWKGRESRLHDRISFTREDPNSDWISCRLQP